VIKEELIEFWKSSVSGCGSRNFLNDPSTLRDGTLLHTLTHISKESDQIFMKMLSQMYPWTRKSPLNFGGNPESGVRIPVGTPDPDQVLLGGGRLCGL